MILKNILFVVLLTLTSTVIYAQDNKAQIKAMKIERSLTIDGKLEEDEWQLVESNPAFIQIEPNQDTVASVQTTVKVLFNKDYIYFGVIAEEPLGKKVIRATDLRRDFNQQQHDVIAIVLDAFNDKRNAVIFVVNAYGAQRDYLSFDDRLFDVDWDAQWKVRTTINENNWIAEIEIPWKTLRYQQQKTEIQSWGLNVFRTRRVVGEQDALSSYPRVFTYARMDYAGVLNGISPPASTSNLKINPYLLFSSQSDTNQSTSNRQENNVKLGGEIKWAVSSKDVLDLTINTDFAQADVDRKVNNITRFSVFFPERRSFFLENNSLFSVGLNPKSIDDAGSMGIQPFFSRKIGLNNDGSPIPIQFGGRFIHRSIKQNFGGMFVRQNKDNKSTDFAVGRYSKNIGAQNRIGVLATFKNDDAGTNMVGSLDGFFRLNDNQTLSTMISVSNSSVHKLTGLAGYAQYYFTNNHFKFWLTESYVDENFNPEIGFISRKDVLATTPGFTWLYRGKYIPFKKYIRGFYPGMAMEMYYGLSDNRVTERQFFVNPIWLAFHKGGYLGYSVYPSYQNLPVLFSPLGVNIHAGEYNYVRQQIIYGTDPSKFISLTANVTFGSYFNGRLTTQDYGLKFSPIPHISFGMNYNKSAFNGVGDVDKKTVDLYSIDARLALNPRLQLTGFYQFISENNQQNYNIRLSYEFKPLSYVYLVFNRNNFQTTDNGLQKQISNFGFIGKISYMYQF